MLQSDLLEFGEKISAGKTYLLPSGSYRLSKGLSFLPSSLSLSESPNLLPPFTTVFWDNQVHFKKEAGNSWEIYNGFSRTTGTLDRSGSYAAVQLYDPFKGYVLLEGTRFKPENAVAVDFSAYQMHPYYRDYRLFNTPNPGLLSYNVKFSDRPYSTGTANPFSLDHVQYAKDVQAVLDNFEENYPGSEQVWVVPYYQAIRALLDVIVNRQPTNDFITKLELARHEYETISNDDQWTLLTLLDAGVDYQEIGGYLIDLYYGQLFVDAGYTKSFQNYDRIIRMDKPVLLPVTSSGEVVVKTNVEDLVANSRNLDIYHVNNPAVFAIKATYKNGASPVNVTAPTLTTLSTKVKKGRSHCPPYQMLLN